MAITQAKVSEIVEMAVTHKWGIPEFQRGFVWKPQKVRDLMDSLYRGYPLGSFLVWYGEDYAQPKTAVDHRTPDGWIVDGQQRTTAFCLLMGRKPYWWEEDWNEALRRHDVRYNVLATEEPFFSLATVAMRGSAGRGWVSVRDILMADDDALAELIGRLIGDLDLSHSSFGKLWMSLDRVRKLTDTPIPVISIMLDLEDVTEVFARLNSAGTKVTEADIALALAASQNPGWARDEFLPFSRVLDEAGFDVDPNVVFRSCIAIGLRRTRLKDVPSTYWRSADLPDAWNRTKAAWQRVVQYVEERGILSSEILPTKNALIPLTILADRHPEAFQDDGPFAWLLHATRSGRYGGASMTALDADARTIEAASDGSSALEQLHARLEPWSPFTAEDFLEDYRDRFLRLMLYLLMYRRGARDWLSHQRLGFQGTELLERFNPDWHHIFPRAHLRKHGVPEEKWNVFANIAVVAPSTNLRFGAKNPMAYLQRYGIGSDLLEEQLVPTDDAALLGVDRYDDFLRLRANALAVASNEFFARLAGNRAFAAAGVELARG